MTHNYYPPDPPHNKSGCGCLIFPALVAVVVFIILFH
jgi:hypothetical protein